MAKNMEDAVWAEWLKEFIYRVEEKRGIREEALV